MGRSIRQWKINRALCRQYGGRIVAQQLCPEPLDAYRRFLEERQAAGDFEIYDTDFKDAFWRYFTDDSIHTFLKADCDSEDRVFETPPWE